VIVAICVEGTPLAHEIGITTGLFHPVGTMTVDGGETYYEVGT
jgi:hypothetical protein